MNRAGGGGNNDTIHGMSPRWRDRRLPLISCGLIFFAAASLAQQQYSWKDNPPPVRVFSQAIEKVALAGLETEAFRSLKGKFDPDNNRWFDVCSSRYINVRMLD
jgi:hypothetical protein